MLAAATRVFIGAGCWRGFCDTGSRNAPMKRALRRAGYRDDGVFADAYCAEVAGTVTLPALLQSFYGSRLFRLERWVLQHLAKRPSTDDDVRALAEDRTERFAAWTVEARRTHQFLLADDSGRTRSWPMVAPAAGGTALHFGSAIVSRVDRRTGAKRMCPLFGVLLGFHRAYSRALLRAAARTLAREPRPPGG